MCDFNSHVFVLKQYINFKYICSIYAHVFQLLLLLFCKMQVYLFPSISFDILRLVCEFEIISANEITMTRLQNSSIKWVFSAELTWAKSLSSLLVSIKGIFVFGLGQGQKIYEKKEVKKLAIFQFFKQKNLFLLQ